MCAVCGCAEGDDKQIKYPDMFGASDVMLLTKIGLLPHLDFAVKKCMDYARRVSPKMEIPQLSAKSGDGMGNCSSTQTA